MIKEECSFTPLPGFVIAIIEESQMTNVSFAGDDKFDLPQTGIMVKMSNEDAKKAFDDTGTPFSELLGRRITWAKYAESDCLIYDNRLQKQVVIISIDKLRGYE